MIDLRSDTLTKPTESMRAAMARAEVEDDVYGEDPTVAAAGGAGGRAVRVRGGDVLRWLARWPYVLAVRSLVAPGQEVLCEASALHRARRARRPRRLLGRHDADLDPPRADRSTCRRSSRSSRLTWRSFFVPPRAAIAVENTHNFAGGAVLPIGDLRDLREYATGVGVAVHMDGARIWNAHVATGVPLAEYGAIADVMAVCLSKGLGAPVGSLMVGNADLGSRQSPRIWRKRMGGGMRQVGVLAAAGLHALDHHIERLADDHAQRPAARRGVRGRSGQRRHRHRGGAAHRRRGLRRGRPRKAGCWSRRSAPPPYASYSPRHHPRRCREGGRGAGCAVAR